MQQKKINRFLLISFICSFFITSLTFFHILDPVDFSVIQWFKLHSSPLFEDFMATLSMIGATEFVFGMTCLILIIFLLKRKFRFAIFFASLSLGGVILNYILKISFQRERPGPDRIIEVFGYSLELKSYSFPSGHTMRSVILFIFLLYFAICFIKKASIKVMTSLVLISFICIVAVSRVITGAHFPSDVLAAISISVFWFFFCLKIFLIRDEKRHNYMLTS